MLILETWYAKIRVFQATRASLVSANGLGTMFIKHWNGRRSRLEAAGYEFPPLIEEAEVV
jgi:hypothetical protein